MPPEQKWKPPILILVLDAIGALLLGLGLAQRFAGIELLPTAWQHPRLDLLLIGLGLALMLPMLFSVLRRARRGGAGG